MKCVYIYIRNKFCPTLDEALGLSFANKVKSNFQIKLKAGVNLGETKFQRDFSETKAIIYEIYNWSNDDHCHALVCVAINYEQSFILFFVIVTKQTQLVKYN